MLLVPIKLGLECDPTLHFPKVPRFCFHSNIEVPKCLCAVVSLDFQRVIFGQEDVLKLNFLDDDWDSKTSIVHGEYPLWSL